MNFTITKKSANQQPLYVHVVSYNTSCDLKNKSKKVGRGNGYNFYEHLWTQPMNDINYDHHKVINNIRHINHRN
jgi:hypothetical protein